MRSPRQSRTLFTALKCLMLVVLPSVALVFAAALGTARGEARGERPSKRLKLGEFNAKHEIVDLFEAMDEGEIAIKFIPKDSTQARVMITNKTKKPLNVKLPEAFGAVPVLAQFGGGGGMGGGGMGGGGGGMGGGGGGGGQSMGGGMGGGGMGGGGMGGGGMGGGGGFFNVAAERVGSFKVQCVCLEHGKPEPRAKMKYKLVPIETVTTNPGVRELCANLGKGNLNQRAAQAAAWHLANEMSWDELADKQIRRANGSRYPYFSEAELKDGFSAATTALNMASEQAEAVASTSAETALKSE